MADLEVKWVFVNEKRIRSEEKDGIITVLSRAKLVQEVVTPENDEKMLEQPFEPATMDVAIRRKPFKILPGQEEPSVPEIFQKHPNFVTNYIAEVSNSRSSPEKQAFFVDEYCDYNLHDIVNQPQILAMISVESIFRQCLEAMDFMLRKYYAYSKPITSRKILLQYDGSRLRVKFGDICSIQRFYKDNEKQIQVEALGKVLLDLLDRNSNVGDLRRRPLLRDLALRMTRIKEDCAIEFEQLKAHPAFYSVSQLCVFIQVVGDGVTEKVGGVNMLENQLNNHHNELTAAGVPKYKKWAELEVLPSKIRLLIKQDSHQKLTDEQQSTPSGLIRFMRDQLVHYSRDSEYSRALGSSPENCIWNWIRWFPDIITDAWASIIELEFTNRYPCFFTPFGDSL